MTSYFNSTTCDPAQPASPTVRAHRWLTGAGLLAGAAMTTAALALTGAPNAYADDPDPTLITTIDGYIATFAGVSDVSDIAPLQTSLVDQISAATTVYQDAASPTVTDYLNILAPEAQLAQVNTAVLYGNAYYLDASDQNGLTAIGNEIQALGPQANFESSISNFYANLPTYVTPADDTNSYIVSAASSALLDQQDASNVVLNLGSVDGIPADSAITMNADNIDLIYFDNALNNATGWLADLVALANAY
jgi:hypothetical protein